MNKPILCLTKIPGWPLLNQYPLISTQQLIWNRSSIGPSSPSYVQAQLELKISTFGSGGLNFKWWKTKHRLSLYIVSPWIEQDVINLNFLQKSSLTFDHQYQIIYCANLKLVQAQRNVFYRAGMQLCNSSRKQRISQGEISWFLHILKNMCYWNGNRRHYFKNSTGLPILGKSFHHGWI